MSGEPELTLADVSLGELHVIKKNKVHCGESDVVASSATTTITLSKPCRHLRIICWTGNAYVTWGSDYTDRVGGRTIANSFNPLDLFLEKPVQDLFFRSTTGTAKVVVMGW